jgi:hypothetical protein
MIFTKRTMAELLESSKMAITNAMEDDELKALLLEYNYDDAKLNEGLELYNRADQLYNKQKKEYGELYAAKESFYKTYKNAHSKYIEHITLTRMAFKDTPKKLVEMSLHERRQKRLGLWLKQSRLFYDAAISDAVVLEKLSKYGVTKEKLEAGKQLLVDVETENRIAIKEAGEAQQATAERDSALEDLDEWISEFYQICKFAFAEKPQLLEKLGITAYSEGYKRRRKKTNEEEPEDQTEESLN